MVSFCTFRLDDLLVGAPLYSNSQFELGRVYAYENSKKVEQLYTV